MCVFKLVLKDGPKLPPHALLQLKAQLLLKLRAMLLSTDEVSHRIALIQLFPIPKPFHGQTLSLPKSTLISSQLPTWLLALKQDLSMFFSTGTLRMLSVYLILSYISNVDVISRLSNTPTVRSHITLITVGTSWPNILIQGNFLLTIFCLNSARS